MTVPPELAALFGKNTNKMCGVSPSDIDKYSRLLFPVFFVSFNMMYWIIYLHISDTLGDSENLVLKDNPWYSAQQQQQLIQKSGAKDRDASPKPRQHLDKRAWHFHRVQITSSLSEHYIYIYSSFTFYGCKLDEIVKEDCF